MIFSCCDDGQQWDDAGGAHLEVAVELGDPPRVLQGPQVVVAGAGGRNDCFLHEFRDCGRFREEPAEDRSADRVRDSGDSLGVLVPFVAQQIVGFALPLVRVFVAADTDGAAEDERATIWPVICSSLRASLRPGCLYSVDDPVVAGGAGERGGCLLYTSDAADE